MMYFLIAGLLTIGCNRGTRTDTAYESDTANLDENSDMEASSGIGSGGNIGMMGAMHQNMMQLDTLQVTGDPDYDFATAMLLHHRASIAMGEDQINHGRDSSLIDLAKKIVESQEQEIERLEKFTSNNKPDENNKEFVQEMEKKIQQMKDDMDNNMKMTGNFDRDFASLMSLHHKHGQDLAETQIKYGKDPELKKYAKEIAEQQKQELKQLEEFD